MISFRLLCIVALVSCAFTAHASSPTHSHNTPTTASASSSSSFAPVFPTWPFVIHTWQWSQAADAAFEQLTQSNPAPGSKPALDALVAGCTQCEVDQCGGTVGYGGSPDENGETTLDALIIDGVTMETGSVSALRNVKNAIGVARAVMEYTKHTMLTGSQATEFAVSMGFNLTNLTTPASEAVWQQWEQNNCQPNMRQNVLPDPTTSCGPYSPVTMEDVMIDEMTDFQQHSNPRSFSSSPLTSPRDRSSAHISSSNHDTIAMVVMDINGNMAAGTSTNGMIHKVPGRVGDAPIPGSGAWVDSDWGGCGATGDGDIMMRFAPCYQAVQNLRAGHTPRQAAEDALGRIERFFDFQGALVVIDRMGNYGAASWGIPEFWYSVRTGTMNETQVITVNPGDWKYTKPMGEKRRNKRQHAQSKRD